MATAEKEGEKVDESPEQFQHKTNFMTKEDCCEALPPQKPHYIGRGKQSTKRAKLKFFGTTIFYARY
jgi:hypothetical protein